jgi:acyl dehydratase
VLSKEEGSTDGAGVVVFRHYGVNQNDELVAQMDRRALIKRRRS